MQLLRDFIIFSFKKFYNHEFRGILGSGNNNTVITYLKNKYDNV